jgi:hypothetical protein
LHSFRQSISNTGHGGVAIRDPAVTVFFDKPTIIS